MISDYKEAIEVSKIPRLNWKDILGMSMSRFIILNKHLNKNQLELAILKQCTDKKDTALFDGFSSEDLIKNIKIGVSARLAEINIYQMKGGLNNNEHRRII